GGAAEVAPADAPPLADLNRVGLRSGDAATKLGWSCGALGPERQFDRVAEEPVDVRALGWGPAGAKDQLAGGQRPEIPAHRQPGDMAKRDRALKATVGEQRDPAGGEVLDGERVGVPSNHGHG